MVGLYGMDDGRVFLILFGDVYADADMACLLYTSKYGAPVTVAEAATAPGYTFSGWSRNDFTMPAENVTITGSFTANSNTEYTVRHHFQNILDDAYDADTAMLSETLSGTTDTLTAAAAKTVAGFMAQSFQQKNIAGDGSTVVDIYYNRNSYGVSYRLSLIHILLRLITVNDRRIYSDGRAHFHFGAIDAFELIALRVLRHDDIGAAVRARPFRMERQVADDLLRGHERNGVRLCLLYTSSCV